MHNKKSSTPRESGNKEPLPWPNQYIADRPTKAAATAAGVGFLMTFLPLGKIVGMLIDVAFALVRPLLLCFGLAKVVDYCRSTGLCDGESETTKPNKR